jgi:undecaprenyl-diphosphatase
MRGITDILAGAVEDTQTLLAWANRDGFETVNTFAIHTGWLHPLMAGYATYGVVLFAGLLLAGWWQARRTTNAPASTAPSPSAPSSSPSPSPSASSAADRPVRRMAAALWAPAGMLIALGLNQIVVASVHELRPYTVLPAAEVLVARSTDYAFPSDHAVMAGAVAAGVWLVSRRLGYLAAAAALLMAFARVYVGAHWPGDVLVGLVFGAAVTMLGYLLWRTPLTSAVTGLARTRLRPLLTAHATALKNLEAEPDRTQGAQLVTDSSEDGSELPWQAADPSGSDPAQSAAGIWARGPRDTMW